MTELSDLVVTNAKQLEGKYFIFEYSSFESYGDSTPFIFRVNNRKLEQVWSGAEIPSGDNSDDDSQAVDYLESNNIQEVYTLHPKSKMPKNFLGTLMGESCEQWWGYSQVEKDGGALDIYLKQKGIELIFVKYHQKP